MIRLKTEIGVDCIERNLNDLFKNDSGVKFYIEKGISRYRYNWNVEEVDPFGNIFSYWIGYWHNSDTGSGKHALVVEYNPNKCAVIGKLGVVLRYYFNDIYNTQLVSFDMACDIDLPLDMFCYDKKNKHDVRKYKDTYYFGKGNYSVRVYDKQKESRLSNALTRYEISIDVKQRLSLAMHIAEYDTSTLPEMLVINTDEEMKALDKAVVLGLQHDPTLLGGFTRTMKAKYKKILERFGRFVPDGEAIANSIAQYLNELNSIISI